MTLGGCGGGFAFGCIGSGGGAAAVALPACPGCIAGSFGAISIAMVLSDKLRRCCGFASAGGGVSVAAPAPPGFAAALRACCTSN